MDQAVYFTTEAIGQFLFRHGRGADTKDYEFVAAVMLKNFCEKQWGVECQIGFKCKPEHMNKLPKEGALALEAVADLFRNGIDEDSPIDCVIVKTDPNERGTRDGSAFQMKRFGIGREQANTDELIQYINALKRKYAKSETSLVIILDGKKDGEIEFPRVRNEVDTTDFPFRRLMFTWMKDNKIYIGETYPEYGMEEYEPEDMIAW